LKNEIILSFLSISHQPQPIQILTSNGYVLSLKQLTESTVDLRESQTTPSGYQ